MPLAWEACQQMIQTWTTLGTKVPLHSEEAEYLLRQVGEPLSNHLLQATTQTIEPTGNWQSFPWWCSYGEPLLLCQYNHGELLDIGSLQRAKFTDTDDRSYGALYLYRLELGEGDFLRGWFLEKYPETDEKSYAQLCMHLIRVHTERECLKQVFGLLQQRLIEAPPMNSDNEQEYIDQAINIVLYGKSPYGLPKSDTRNILAIAQGFDQLLNEDQWLSLLETIRHFRPQLLDKLRNEQLGAPKRLAIEEREKLVDLFLACAAVNDSVRRDAIVAALPDNIKAQIAYNGAPKTHVLNILTIVRDFSGGLQELVKAVGLYEGATIPFNALQNGIQQLLPGEIDIQEN
ncbi:MAG: hypothetical protein H7Y37_15765 [Anaerolineae bacterium]|nr:hypothetical protein [Gloeobacterales cyanobacterium ES-bin-313]